MNVTVTLLIVEGLIVTVIFIYFFTAVPLRRNDIYHAIKISLAVREQKGGCLRQR